MTKLVEYEDEPHPIISEALAETDEIVVQEAVTAGSEAEGKSLRDLQMRTEIGMEVLAIQRGGRWIYRPRASQTLLAGDKVIAVGPEDGAHDLAVLFGTAPAEEE